MSPIKCHNEPSSAKLSWVPALVGGVGKSGLASKTPSAELIRMKLGLEEKLSKEIPLNKNDTNSTRLRLSPQKFRRDNGAEVAKKGDPKDEVKYEN